MAPFVPDFISEQLNLLVALVLGVGFGFVLEQAGFSSSRRLAGVFYGYDFTVLRVFFTAAMTAMGGVLLLGYFGMLDTDAIFVNPTWLLPAIAGGVLMGIGFIVGGYCPGTSVCAAAIGKIDAMFFVGGGILGVFLFAELYPLYHAFYESTSLGPVHVFDSIGMSGNLFALMLVLVAVGAFVVTSMIEKKVNPSGAPSLEFKRPRHIAAGSVTVLGALILFVMPDRKTALISETSSDQYAPSHPVRTIDSDELAFRITDHDSRLTLIDIRQPDASARAPLPAANRFTTPELFSKDAAALLAPRHTLKVVIGSDETSAKNAAMLIDRLGYENIAYLKGGMSQFSRDILDSAAVFTPVSRWDGDVIRFRRQARVTIGKMIAELRAKGSAQKKQEKKIQGGC